MKKQLWIIPVVIILVIFLAACGVEEVHEVADPINREAWPTSVPTAAPVSPTPFPEFDFEHTGANTPTPAPVDNPTPTPESVATVVDNSTGTGTTDVNEALMGQISALLRDQLSPVSVALVVPDNVAVRQGPGDGYGAVTTLERSTLVGVLGKNSGGDWLYVIDMALNTGWLPADDLRITGTFEDAPVLPPDPIAMLLEQALSGGAEESLALGSDASAPAPAEVTDLTAVATATVNNPLLNIRQRPGADFELLATLAEGDEVSVLALNQDKQWALVETADGNTGWASLELLAVDGNLSAAPQLVSLAPGPDYPADQVAPLAFLSGQPVAVSAFTGGASGRVSPAAMSVSSSPVMPARVLAPVAAGKFNRKVELLREPNPSAGLLATLVDEPVTVLAVNDARDWAVVQTTNSRAGWVPVDSLTLSEGTLDNAYPVTTAWVQSNELELKSGPGIFHDKIGVVAINNLVAVLAQNEGGNWVLVEPLSGGRGWMTPKFLNMMVPLAQIPLSSSFSYPEPEIAAEPAPAVPLRPAKNLIALQTSSGGDIMLINPDGSNLRRLTSGIDPVLSPDGEAVAFTRWQGDSGSLWTINTDGGNERFVLGEMRKAKGPDWSPDGSQIVLNYQHGGRLDTTTVSFDLSKNPNPTIPWNAIDIEVVLEPIVVNGQVVGMKPIMKVTLPPDPHWGLRLVNLADGSSEDVDGGTYAFRPAWHPGRDWYVVSDGGRGLLGIDVNRPEYRERLTENIGDSSPAFSPDGRYLAVTFESQGGYDLYRMNADGSGRVRLTNTPLWETSGPDEKPAWNNVAPVWSPDGSQIAFLTDRTGRWEIWVMNADGSDPQPMFSDAVNDQLDIQYNFVDERVFSWR
jgi:TolB protein